MQNQFGGLLSFTKFMWFFGIKKRNIEQITNEAIKACSDLREQRCADRLDQSLNKVVAIVKSLLINGENLIEATLSKLANFALQLQRLNRETRFYRDAIVRTA